MNLTPYLCIRFPKQSDYKEAFFEQIIYKQQSSTRIGNSVCEYRLI